MERGGSKHLGDVLVVLSPLQDEVARHFKGGWVHLGVQEVLWNGAGRLGQRKIVREQKEALPAVHHQDVVRDVRVLQHDQISAPPADHQNQS